MFGQGLYELCDVNLMERQMIHYLSWDLTISGPDRRTITPEPASAKKPTPLPIHSLRAGYCRLSFLHFDRSLTAVHYIYRRRESYLPILTRHLAPLASRHHRRLVPRRHPTKTRVCRRQQEASLSTSTFSTSSDIKMKH